MFNAIKNKDLSYADPLVVLSTQSSDSLIRCLFTCTQNINCIMVKYSLKQCTLFSLIQTQYLISYNTTVLYQINFNGYGNG